MKRLASLEKVYQADTHITGDIVQLTSKLPMSLES